MKSWIERLLIIVFICFTACKIEVKYNKEQKIFTHYLKANLESFTKLKDGRYIIIPENGCNGCLDKANHVLMSCQGSEKMMVISNNPLYNKSFNVNTFIERTDSDYPLENLFFVGKYPLIISVNEGAINSIISLTPQDSAVFVEQVSEFCSSK